MTDKIVDDVIEQEPADVPADNEPTFELTDAQIARAEQIDALPLSEEQKERLMGTPDEEFTEALLNVIPDLAADSRPDPGKAAGGQDEVPVYSGNYDIPSYDIDAGCTRIEEAMDQGDSKTVTDELRKVFATITGTTQLVADALNEQDATILPSKVRNVLSSVKGATDEDYEPAMKILRSGETSDPMLAIKLAAFDRMSTKKKPSAAASAAAEKMARALKANSRGTHVRRSERPPIALTLGNQDLIEAMKREEERRQKAK